MDRTRVSFLMSSPPNVHQPYLRSMNQADPLIPSILEKLGIEQLNDMQLASIEAGQTASDLVLLSPTGSGKTLAFLLPVVLGLQENIAGIQALIIAPSRELALQIEKVFKGMGTRFKVNCFYGGHDINTEINNLLQPPAVLIGTPGRLAEHIRKANFAPATIRTLVLDEFDKSLEFGFETDMIFIIGQLTELKKRILTSATQTIDIQAFTGIANATALNFLTHEITDGLTLKLVKADNKDKAESLLKLLAVIGSEPTLVFCNHRETVEQISKFLFKKGLVHDIYHGKLEQYEREMAIAKFRNGSNNILISTDLASRGLDIDEMKNVVHYHIPATEAVYTHRNGRTARMEKEGTAYLLMSEEEYLPGYITSAPEWLELPVQAKLPANPAWTTIHITGGKKEKINKIDIVGLLLKKGGLAKDELGLIEVGDHHSYAAVKKQKAQLIVSTLGQEKIKGYRLKLEIAR
ncbi:MAG: DEAD/DEAH box helicase [Chitinophagaceae bacterium]